MTNLECIDETRKELKRAGEMIELIMRIAQFPELPLFITRPGVTRALEIPFNERENLMHFCLVVWETEYKRLEYFLNKYLAIERGGNEG